MLNTFILLSILFIIHETTVVINPSKIDKQIKEISKNIKVGYFNPNDRPFMIFNLFYFIWTIVGLFTNYWIVFIGLISIGLFSSFFSKKSESTISRIKLRRLDSTMCILLLTLLLIIHQF